MHEHRTTSVLTLVFVLSNLAIVAGYLAVPFTKLGRRIPMTAGVRVAGMLFFATCAITHLAMAMFWPLRWPLIVDHIVQAAAVWYFVLGFSKLIAEAEVMRRPPAATADPPGPGEP